MKRSRSILRVDLVFAITALSFGCASTGDDIPGTGGAGGTGATGELGRMPRKPGSMTTVTVIGCFRGRGAQASTSSGSTLRFRALRVGSPVTDPQWRR